jgi:DNA mismatch repair protein MutS2
LVQELRGSRVLVAVGSKRLWVERDDVRLEDREQPPRPATRVDVETSDRVADELMLLGMDSEDARREVELFLDRAFAAGKRTVRLVHGHGTGVLRRLVGEICRQHPAVHAFSHPPSSRGGTGATEVTLEES